MIFIKFLILFSITNIAIGSIDIQDSLLFNNKTNNKASLRNTGTAWPTFFLFTNNNINTAININSSSLRSSSYNNALRTYLIIHGFLDNGNNQWILDIKNRLLQRERANVIVVDWSQGSIFLKQIYPTQSNDWIPYYYAATNSRTTGTRTAELLLSARINLNNVHCIGHSLGAHACGFVGKLAKLDRITGMDPAGPSFYTLSSSSVSSTRLDRGDARLVDVIHTDDWFGITSSIGHQDFWVNNGENQPGCAFTLQIHCSHMRATQLFLESILSSNKFQTSVGCSSYYYWRLGFCNCRSNCPRMGFFASQNTVNGNFYLTTNSASPFSRS